MFRKQEIGMERLAIEKQKISLNTQQETNHNKEFEMMNERIKEKYKIIADLTSHIIKVNDSVLNK